MKGAQQERVLKPECNLFAYFMCSNIYAECSRLTLCQMLISRFDVLNHFCFAYQMYARSCPRDSEEKNDAFLNEYIFGKINWLLTIS